MTSRCRWSLSLLVLLATAGRAPAAGPPTTQPFTYRNPLPFGYDQGQTARRTEVRDPCILRDGDTYYLVFTMWPFSNREEKHLAEPNDGGSPGIALYASKDLKDWRFQNWVVKAADLPADCPYKDRFWAPELHKINGKFYVIFTADNWQEKRFNPAGTWGAAGYTFVGVADRVTGPYGHVCYLPGGACDTTLFGDVDGQTYAVSPRYDVHVRRVDLTHMDQGRLAFDGPDQVAVRCKNDDVGLPTSPAYLEGPWVERIGRRYCLFYAEIYKDKAHPELLGYRTNVAYADGMAGPWRKDPRGAVFFGGHLSVFDGPGDRKWFAYRWEKTDARRGGLCVDPFDLDADGRVRAAETIGVTVTVPADR